MVNNVLGGGRCFWGSALCTKLVFFFVFGWGRVFFCVFFGVVVGDLGVLVGVVGEVFGGV